MVGNASAAFPDSLLSASASLSNHFFKVPLSFGEPPVPPLPPPVMARIIVAMVIEKAVSIEKIVMPCSLNKVRIYQELFQLSTWSFQPVFGDPSDSVTVFLALPVFWYSNHLIYLCTTVFVHRSKYLSQYAY